MNNNSKMIKRYHYKWYLFVIVWTIYTMIELNLKKHCKKYFFLKILIFLILVRGCFPNFLTIIHYLKMISTLWNIARLAFCTFYSVVYLFENKVIPKNIINRIKYFTMIFLSGYYEKYFCFKFGIPVKFWT